MQVRMLLILAAAGALGTLSRYGLGGLTEKVNNTGFPYGTLLINLCGCFIIGLVMQVALSTNFFSPTARTAITIGFLGAFTTFSTFSYESVKLIENNEWIPVLLNVTLNAGGGITLTLLGTALGKTLTGGI